jgi:two-component system, NtrC family, sensor kinase
MLAQGLIQRLRQFLEILPDNGESPIQYDVLRNRILFLMLMVSLIPLVLMAGMNHYQYQRALRGEVIQPMRTLITKTKQSFEHFLEERRAAVAFVASVYSFDELADQRNLQRIFTVMKQAFGGFVDLGLIDEHGMQVSYVGPYDLKGKNYSDQNWYHEVLVRGEHISDVFMGYRRFPHMVIAVKHLCDQGGCWILRATVDTEKFNTIISYTGQDTSIDAFIVNREGILQTPSKYFGGILNDMPMPLPPASFEPTFTELPDRSGQQFIVGYSYFVSQPMVLILVKPQTEILKSWYGLEGDLLLVFVISVVVIMIVIFRLTNVLVSRIESSEKKRRLAFHEMEYTNKLASIGRLAAGVAHEINNPLAIINEKAGLMMDVIDYTPDFKEKEKFVPLVGSILNSVDRCRTITHRLLGFARRMDISVQVIDLNAVVREVFGFLEKEAMHRNIEVVLDMDENLPRIASDQGQLQQVFLNILANAFAAVNDGGLIMITSQEVGQDMVQVTIQDNGIGMSEETMSHIFEPFFSTKKGSGTGLGLSITYGIVKKLGGSIEVESKEGSGSTFRVNLPQKAELGLES